MCSALASDRPCLLHQAQGVLGRFAGSMITKEHLVIFELFPTYLSGLLCSCLAPRLRRRPRRMLRLSQQAVPRCTVRLNLW